MVCCTDSPMPMIRWIWSCLFSQLTATPSTSCRSRPSSVASLCSPTVSRNRGHRKLHYFIWNKLPFDKTPTVPRHRGHRKLHYFIWNKLPFEKISGINLRLLNNLSLKESASWQVIWHQFKIIKKKEKFLQKVPLSATDKR